MRVSDRACRRSGLDCRVSIERQRGVLAASASPLGSQSQHHPTVAIAITVATAHTVAAAIAMAASKATRHSADRPARVTHESFQPQRGVVALVRAAPSAPNALSAPVPV